MTDHTKYRILEMIPGTLLWTTLIGALALSFLKPLWVIYFIIIFCTYWLFRVFYFVTYLVISWRRLRRDINKDWLVETKQLPDWESYYHLIFLPFSTESDKVLRTTFQSLVDSNYPLEKMIVVLAGEERKMDVFKSTSEVMQKEFGEKFHKLIITCHPDNLPGEIKAKGANAYWAALKSKEYIDEEKISYEKIIVSYFDSDTCVHSQYFAYLSYKYITNPKRERVAYQPVAFYNNNIWDSLALMRVVAFGTTFWLLTELSKPERLFTFSSHSISYKALIDVGFWQKDTVTDDSRIFLQCFIRYGGDFEVIPMYMPVSMDTVMAENIWSSLKNLYKQQRRWAWGVEHFPYMVWYFSKGILKTNTGDMAVSKIPFLKRFKYLWNLTEGMYSWATAPILIFILSRLPLWTGREQFGSTVFFQTAPVVLEWLLTGAMVGMLASAILFLFLLPPKPVQKNYLYYIVMVLQWIFLPIALIFFGSIPAIEAQTRLMIGKPLGFAVTEKARK